MTALTTMTCFSQIKIRRRRNTISYVILTTTSERYLRFYVELNYQQRTTRKCLTIIQGLDDDIDEKKVIKTLKKVCFNLLHALLTYADYRCSIVLGLL